MHVQVQLDRKTKNEKESKGWRTSHGVSTKILAPFSRCTNYD